MTVGDVRKGVTQSTFNEEAVKVVITEIILVAAGVGYTYQSWYVGGGLFLGLMIALHIPRLNLILAVGFSVVWSLIAAFIAHYFFGDGFPSIDSDYWSVLLTVYSIPASQVLGVMFFLSGLGYHLAAIEWSRDVSSNEDRNF